jgi:hypothetical protein
MMIADGSGIFSMTATLGRKLVRLFHTDHKRFNYGKELCEVKNCTVRCGSYLLTI